MEMIRKKLFILLTTAFLLAAISAIALTLGREKRAEIVVGGKGVEGEILAEIIVQHLEKRLSLPARKNGRIDGTFIIFEALKGGEIDLYVEYTGTALSAILGERREKRTRSEVYSAVKEGLSKWGLETLLPLGFQNQYVLLMQPETAEREQIKALSDLLIKGSHLKVCFDQEFCGREEFDALKNLYHLSFPQLQMMDHILLYLTLEKEGCDLINGYSTDGRSRNFLMLVDDQEEFPAYEAVPIVRRELLERYPDLEEVLNQLAGKISEEAMQEMNYQVEVKGESIPAVARRFLERV